MKFLPLVPILLPRFSVPRNLLYLSGKIGTKLIYSPKHNKFGETTHKVHVSLVKIDHLYLTSMSVLIEDLQLHLSYIYSVYLSTYHRFPLTKPPIPTLLVLLLPYIHLHMCSPLLPVSRLQERTLTSARPNLYGYSLPVILS